MLIEVHPIKVGNLHFKNYCYLVIEHESKQAILIDPAWEIDKINQILSVTDAKLMGILLTHHHYDHVNLAEPLSQHHNIPVIMSNVESAYYNFTCYNLRTIAPLESIQLGIINIKPLLTPGHTHGAFCYWINNSLFTGDTLFTEGCGICGCKGGDPSAMFESLTQLKSSIPLETRIYPGHSFGQEPGKTFSYLLANNIYLQFNSRDDFIAYRMRGNQKGLFAFQ